jgi:hypothetical protein
MVKFLVESPTHYSYARSWNPNLGGTVVPAILRIHVIPFLYEESVLLVIRPTQFTDWRQRPWIVQTIIYYKPFTSSPGFFTHRMA